MRSPITSRNHIVKRDNLGGRLKTVTRDGVKTTFDYDKKWLYRDSLRPEAEVNAAGVFTHYVYASNDPNSGAPIALIRAGVLYRVVKDHLGSVRMVGAVRPPPIDRTMTGAR